MKSQSGLLDEEDLASYSAVWGEPASIAYRDYKIYETAPNSQAITALIGFNILSHFDLSKMKLGSLEYLRTLIETSEIAYEYRRKYIADPDYMKVSVRELLDAGKARKEAEALHEKLGRSTLADFSAPDESKKKESGDTTYFCIVDSDHNCVSCIQSNYMGFGSGIVPEGTGINLQNRGCYFSLDKSHHNSLEPKEENLPHALRLSDDERRQSLPALWNNGRRYSAPDSHAGDFQHSGLWHRCAASDRGPTLVQARNNL